VLYTPVPRGVAVPRDVAVPSGLVGCFFGVFAVMMMDSGRHSNAKYYLE